MDRRSFLKKLGIGGGAVLIVPALIPDEPAVEHDFQVDEDWADGEGWTVYGDNAIQSGNSYFKHHEEHMLVEGRRYKLSFNYHTPTGDPPKIRINCVDTNRFISIIGEADQNQCIALEGISLHEHEQPIFLT